MIWIWEKSHTHTHTGWAPERKRKMEDTVAVGSERSQPDWLGKGEKDRGVSLLFQKAEKKRLWCS